jgi:uncharacterized protein YdhG (YjbR/CyaY superfamily)
MLRPERRRLGRQRAGSNGTRGGRERGKGAETVEEKGAPKRSEARSIDEYIAEFPAAVQKVLEEVRATIHAVAPTAVETISYAIPTFDLNGRHLVHFAGYAHHVGFYPVTPGASEAFASELASYKRGKGSVQFPLDRPMPMDLIRRMVEYRVAESAESDLG